MGQDEKIHVAYHSGGGFNYAPVTKVTTKNANPPSSHLIGAELRSTWSYLHKEERHTITSPPDRYKSLSLFLGDLSFVRPKLCSLLTQHEKPR